MFKNLKMHITGLRGWVEAIITKGGVNVKEIDPSTMESKKVKGLYFAGQRTMMPGGLPTTVYAGRKAVEYLCRDNNTMLHN